MLSFGGSGLTNEPDHRRSGTKEKTPSAALGPSNPTKSTHNGKGDSSKGSQGVLTKKKGQGAEQHNRSRRLAEGLIFVKRFKFSS